MNGDHERLDTFSTVRRGTREYPIDHTKRRHSIAAGAPGPLTLPIPSATHGTKRKLSTDRSTFLPVGEESDSRLTGPGVPSIPEAEVEFPAPKRRGSTIDTHRIAQLCLDDRRSSVDSRAHPPWGLTNERRESAPALYPSVSMPGFAQALNGGENGPSKLPSSMASFSWDQDHNAMQTDSDPRTHRTLDPSNTIPPLSYPPDRRMSVPDSLVNPSNRIGPVNSRPPSRQDTGSSSHSGHNSVHEDGHANTAPSNPVKTTTPYSRSPELRVSHKLAERARRKEMKDLYDDLRDLLPQDRGMKASKHETLSKGVFCFRSGRLLFGF